MGPTKAIVKANTLYEAASGKLIKDGFASSRDIEDYVKHHYLALPVVDNAGNPWLLGGETDVLFPAAVNTKRWTTNACNWRVVRIAEEWASDRTNLRWNPIASVACPADRIRCAIGNDGNVEEGG